MPGQSYVDLTISIVDWNSGQLIVQCLDSIFATVKNHSFKVFVIDNDSTTKSIDTIARLFPDASVIENPENVGFARAHNQILSNITSRYVLLLNPDTVLGEGTVDRVTEYMDEHPRVGISGCKVLFPDGSIQQTVMSFLSVSVETKRVFREYCYPLNRVFFKKTRDIGMVSPAHTKPAIVDAIGGPFILMRTDMVRDIGLLEEAFFLFSEERDLCLRAGQKNWGCAYVPDVSVYHMLGKCRDQAPCSLSTFHFCRSRLLYFMKHHGRIDTMFLCLVYAFFSLWILAIEFSKMTVSKVMGMHRDPMYQNALASLDATWDVIWGTRFFSQHLTNQLDRRHVM